MSSNPIKPVEWVGSSYKDFQSFPDQVQDIMSKIRRGTNNVFADLGYSDPDTQLLKAQLVSRIDEIMCDRKLTQTQAAQAMGISQPDVSRLLKGQFRDVSVERIMRMLMRLGCKVDIVIKPPGRKLAGSVIHLQHAHP